MDRRIAFYFISFAVAWVLTLGPSNLVFGQVPPTVPRPSEIRPELPPFREPSRSPFLLPPVPVAPSQEDKISPGVRVFIREVKVSGNTVVPTEELSAIAKDFEGRIVSTDELYELRNRLTLVYVNKGYVNSGAVLPDQQIKDGVVRYEIVEGKLSQVDVNGNERLNPRYVTDRIRLSAGPPLNVNDLQQRLQILQQSGLIERINAELAPGVQPGESVLKVNVQEAPAYELGLIFNNRRPPSVGSYQGEIYFTHRNISGFGDAVDARFGRTEGLESYLLGYSLPINAYDTRAFIGAEKVDSKVIERPFDTLDITSKSSNYQIGVMHPVWRTVNAAVNVGARFEKRESSTSLLGQPFSFSPGVPNGTSKVNVLRLSQELLMRTPDQVIAARSTVNAGKTNADPQIAGIGPGGDFVSWLAQLQWVRRVFKDHQLIMRTDFQTSNKALMSLEKISIGGAGTVRGYRENQVLADSGLILSLEYRIPVWQPVPGKGSVQFAMFGDYGHAWNSDPTAVAASVVASYGFGLLWEFDRHFQAQIYLARASHHFAQTTHDLQDSGIHFTIAYYF